MIEDRLVNIKDAAEILAISPWTVRAWIAQSKITSAKMGTRRLIPESEIKRLLADGMRPRKAVKDAATIAA
ncbi:MAG: helix-turn-helix domain-containing protein [Pyrinomonadaceae bacterium]